MVVLHDLTPNDAPAKTQSNNQLPLPPILDEKYKSVDFTNSNDGEHVLPKKNN